MKPTRRWRGFLVVTIDAASGWHIGAEDDHFGGPQGLLGDDGVPRIPVTSLMGSLRDFLRRAENAPWCDALRAALGCDESVDLATALLGPQPEPKASNADDNEGLTASPLWGLSVDVAKVDGSAWVEKDVVEHGRTAIDRFRGAAKESTLRQRAEVNVETRVTLRLRLDRPESVVAAVASALLAWQPRIGGGRTTGSGAARVVGVTYGVLDLASVDGLVALWSLCRPELVDDVATVLATGEGARTSESVVLRQTFEVTGDLRVGSGEAEETLSHEGDPDKRGELYLYRANGHYVVPGTTWKGIVRSRFEYVLDTVGACCDGWTPEAGERVVERVFGSQNRAGELVFRDSLVLGAVPDARNRNAIDRFTGGVMDGALFPETTLRSADNGEQTVELVIDHMPRKPGDLLGGDPEVDAVMRKLLAWVVRDLGDGLVGVGSRVTTGLGTLSAVGPRESPPRLTTDDIALLVRAVEPSVPVTEPVDDTEPPKKAAPTDEGTSSDSSTLRQQGHLVAYGEVDWPVVAEALRGMDAVWFDLEGPHPVESVPESAPVGATHLWAWDSERLARARIQDDKSILAELWLDGSAPPTGDAPAVHVTYALHGGSPTWCVDDGRLGNVEQAKTLVKMPTDVYVVDGPTPLEFVRVRKE
jgi:hypothetical protein